MRHYCTYFDAHYCLRGLTLYRSLQKHAGEFTLWVLCCDEASFQNLQTLDMDNLKPVRLAEVETFEPRLREAKSNRNPIEYLWTLSPIWPLYLFERDASIELLTYLDADLFLYASPQPLFDEMGDGSIAMFSHRLPDRTRHMEEFGVYNVGWLSFRRDKDGLACLKRWREQCLEWCYDRCEDGKHGDQCYLDSWPDDYAGTRVLEHEGAGVAPWNWTRYRFSRRDGQLYSNEAPLIFFHFHGLRFLTPYLYDPYFSTHQHGVMPASQRQLIFGPYIRAMIQTARWARARGCRISWGHLSVRGYLKAYGPRLFLSKLARRAFAVHAGLN